MDRMQIPNEQNARDILEVGLAKSAQSLSVMINSHVELTPLEISLVGKELNDFLSHPEMNTLILKTELVGPVGGINYMLLSKSAVTAICQKCFNDEFSEEDIKNLTIEFLKEVENVLAAATISEIADRFQVDMYGDVPKIQAVESSKVINVIDSETLNMNPHLQLRCELVIPELSISMNVIWVFDSNFLSMVDATTDLQKAV